MIDTAIDELTVVVEVRAACAAAGRPRASHYRRRRQSPTPARKPVEPKPQPRALTATEQTEVLDLLHADRFVDLSPGCLNMLNHVGRCGGTVVRSAWPVAGCRTRFTCGRQR